MKTATIHFACPACGKALSVKPSMAGLKGQCPACQAHVPVPGTKLATTVFPSPLVAAAEDEPLVHDLPGIQKVRLVDAEMPLGSMARFIFRWTIAALPTLFALWLLSVLTLILTRVLFGA